MERNKLALIVTLLSFVMLVPGVSLPMLWLKIDASVRSDLTEFSLRLLDQKNSILGTVGDLYAHDKVLVAFLIFLFSVLVPLLKGIILGFAVINQNEAIKPRLVNLVRRIAKWSMADVFVVAIFLAYLSTHGQPSQTSHEANILGFTLQFKMLLGIDSELEIGFYFFLSYCLLSLLGTELLIDPK